VKAVEEGDDEDIGDEPEDPLMLSRDAKDWKVRSFTASSLSRIDILTS
jgi:hypothetical protein